MMNSVLPLKKTAPLFFQRSRPRAFRKLRIVLAGCGQVGTALLQLKKPVHFTATCRSLHEKGSAIRQLQASPIQIHLDQTQQLKRLCRLSNRIIWMAPPLADQTPDLTFKRVGLYLSWAQHQYSRPTKPCVTYISTTGVYGHTQGKWIDERSSVQPETPRAQRRVVQERHLQFAFTKQRAHVHILRAPGIYSASRLPIERLQRGTPALLPEEDAWSNHIHEIDLARLAWWCHFKARPLEVINACDEQPMKMGDYFDLVAHHFQLPRPPRKSAAEVKAEVSPMLWSFMQESRKIRSHRQKALHFKLQYPSVADFLSRKDA